MARELDSQGAAGDWESSDTLPPVVSADVGVIVKISMCERVERSPRKTPVTSLQLQYWCNSPVFPNARKISGLIAAVAILNGKVIRHDDTARNDGFWLVPPQEYTGISGEAATALDLELGLDLISTTTPPSSLLTPH